MARDQFQTQDTSEYDPDSIWRGSADKQGHSSYFRTPVPKHWGGQMNAIVQSDLFEYKSTQDFIRDAIYHRLHWAGTVMQDRKFLARLGVDKLQAHLEHYMVEAEGFREFVGRLEDAARTAGAANDSKQFAAVLDVMRDEAQATLREPFRTDATDRLNVAFEEALERAETERALRNYSPHDESTVIQISVSDLEAERLRQSQEAG